MWLTALMIHSVIASSLAFHHRRSMGAPAVYPVSKGGWRPVVGTGSLPGFAPFPAAPLHAPPAYKIPVPVEQYPSSSRPIAARDAAKMTSVPQHQYRPTTLRNLPASSSPSQHQPINSYLNPFGLQNGLSHYKIVQNFPMESVVIRNPHNPFAARPTFSKYPMKYKQQFSNAVFQQLNNVQPVHFGGQYAKPHDFSKPVEVYVRPTDAKKVQSYKDPNAPEIFKPEVYKLPDSDSASQNQQVKTAQQQQQNLGNVKPPTIYQNLPFKEEKFSPLPASILGQFNTFGVQSIKGRDPVFPMKQTTYVPPLPTKQTVFNSFSYTPTFKTSANPFITTTPKLQPTPQHSYNHVLFGSTNNFKVTPTQEIKLSTQYKNDVKNKGSFKASPQDPFSKHQQQLNKYHSTSKHPQVTTYSPTVPTTTPTHFFNNDLSGRLPSQPQQQHAPFTSYYNQNYDKKKHKHHDNYASGVNNAPSSQYPSPPKKQEFEATPDSVPFRATYDVTELYGDDVITYSSPHLWSPAPDSHYNQYTPQRPIEEVTTKTVFNEVNHPNTYSNPTTVSTNLPEEYEIVTESYINAQYNSHLETQSHRPLGDDFEPIGKHKLKDYYYKVSTPAQTDLTTHYKRTKPKPTETPTKATESTVDYTTVHTTSEHDQIGNLPTLPPSLHFKRPSANEPLDKDKIRKRNKIRRRRPPQNRVTEKEETSTRATDTYTTENDEVHTYRPRPRIPPSYNKKPTTPSVTTDLSTSALPTINPTTPTTHVVRKKIRKPITTTTDRYETTTISYRESELNRESPIMKIASRDYSHKQDEKDTPTSDVSVITDTTGRSRPEPMKFSFHKDVKPLEAKTELLVKGVEKFDVKSTTNKYSETTKKDNIEESTEVVTTTPKAESTSYTSGKITRPRLKSKYEITRPRFSVKDYRNRLNSTTTTEKSVEPQITKLRFPTRRLPFQEKNENSTESRKKFVPKDSRNKIEDDLDPTTEVQSRNVYRQRSTTTEAPETPKISSRVRYTQRRKPVEDTTEPVTQTHKRPLRKKIKDTDMSESVQDVSVTETTKYEDTSTERKKSESAIMKIAKDEKKYEIDQFEHSKRVSDLTLASSKDYNTPGMFKTVSPNSRRIPNYFTIATDDPILPIEAFFPQINQKKE